MNEKDKENDFVTDIFGTLIERYKPDDEELAKSNPEILKSLTEKQKKALGDFALEEFVDELKRRTPMDDSELTELENNSLSS